MAVQWTPLRLSMVAGNEVNSLNRIRPSYSYRPHRKMADVGIQCDPDDSGMFSEPPAFSSTVAEINTSGFSTAAEINSRVENSEVDSPSAANVHPARSRPHSTGSSTSNNSSGRDRGRLNSDGDDEVDVDAIRRDEMEMRELAQEQTEGKETEEDSRHDPTFQPRRQEEPSDKLDTNCGIDCIYYTMKCCECTIL